MSEYNYFDQETQSAPKDDFDLDADKPSIGVKSKTAIVALIVSFAVMIKDQILGGVRAGKEAIDGEVDLSDQVSEPEEMPGRLKAGFKLITNENAPVKPSSELDDNNIGSEGNSLSAGSGQASKQLSPPSNVVPFTKAQGANTQEPFGTSQSKANVVTTNDGLDFSSIKKFEPSASDFDALDVGDKVEEGPDDDDPRPTPWSNRLPVVTAPVMLGQLHVNSLLVISFSDLLENSYDLDDDQLSIENLKASSGTLEQTGPISWTFRPSEEDIDDVKFSYEISDGTGSISQHAALELLPPAGKVIEGSAGNDALPGTAYDDVIIGRAGDDLINAGDGDDIIFGSAGNDEIYAGDGDDIVYGGAGDDLIFGGAGNDHLFGDDGADKLFGESGNDELDGGAGNDEIYAGDGDDIVYGGVGDDLILGGAGKDHLFGDDGVDTLFGESGNDELDGGAGNDQIFAGEGDDLVHGGDGDDELTGGDDKDAVDGGGGNDLFLATILDGDDHYSGGEGTDTYDISMTSADALVDLSQDIAVSSDIGEDRVEGIENVVGGSGNDVIVANDQTNILTGGAGEDIFVFNTASHASSSDGERDHITDLEVGDRIDISNIDGDEIEDGNQSFQLIQNGSEFTEAGQIRTRYEYFDEEEHTIIEGNPDDDDDVEFEIDLDDHHDLDDGYFIGVG